MKSYLLDIESPVDVRELNELGIIYQHIPTENREPLEQLCKVLFCSFLDLIHGKRNGDTKIAMK